ncbi:MAG: HIT domain-containing protein [Patescibacteria group bacterium]
MNDCIFCKIVKGEIPCNKVSETDNVLAFYDIHPSAEVHVLVVPKRHISDFENIKKEDSEIISEMIEISQAVVKKENPSKFRIIINGRGFLEINHLHWHLQGGSLTKHAVEALLNDSR